MRLSPDDLKRITGLQIASAQARWFKQHFGITVPCDRAGPIITRGAFDALIMKKVGVAANDSEARPQVRLTVSKR